MKATVKWLKEPEIHNYPAAESYLNLIFSSRNVESLLEKLKKNYTKEFRSKDILRASGLSCLPSSNDRVEKNLRKIDNGEELSPVLLVKDTSLRKVIVADGYYRLSATYLYDENAWVSCKIVEI